MARPVRVAYEDAAYHVRARANEQKAICNDLPDYETFLNTFPQARAAQPYRAPVLPDAKSLLSA